MALLTLTQAKVFAGIASADTTRDGSLAEIVDEAIDAVLRYCNNGALEAIEYTQVLDAPPTDGLVLPFAPVTYDPDPGGDDDPIDFSLYVNFAANGNPAAFTSAHLKVPYTDYALDLGPADVTVSATGIVRSLTGVWGANFDRPVYALQTKLVPVRGAVKVVYTAGYATVPPSLRGALNLLVRKIFHMRKLGVPVTSESLNGYSYSAQNSVTAAGVLQGDQTIRGMLSPFCRPQVGGYY